MLLCGCAAVIFVMAYLLPSVASPAAFPMSERFEERFAEKFAERFAERFMERFTQRFAQRFRERAATSPPPIPTMSSAQVKWSPQPLHSVASLASLGFDGLTKASVHSDLRQAARGRFLDIFWNITKQSGFPPQVEAKLKPDS